MVVAVRLAGLPLRERSRIRIQLSLPPPLSSIMLAQNAQGMGMFLVDLFFFIECLFLGLSFRMRKAHSWQKSQLSHSCLSSLPCIFVQQSVPSCYYGIKLLTSPFPTVLLGSEVSIVQVCLCLCLNAPLEALARLARWISSRALISYFFFHFQLLKVKNQWPRFKERFAIKISNCFWPTRDANKQTNKQTDKQTNK